MQNHSVRRRGMMVLVWVAAAGAMLLGAMNAHAGRLEFNNTFSDKYVWITTVYRGDQIGHGCVDPGKKIAWSDYRYRTSALTVRAEVMSAPGCKGEKSCDTDLELKGRDDYRFTPGSDALYIRPHAVLKDRCYINFSQYAAANNFRFKNGYSNRYAWITTYYVTFFGDKQIESGCVNPGQERTFNSDRYLDPFTVRVEVMSAAECKGTLICGTDTNDGKLAMGVYPNAKDVNRCFLKMQ